MSELDITTGLPLADPVSPLVDWWNRGGIAGSLGMTPVDEQIRQAAAASAMARTSGEKVSAAMSSPFANMIAPGVAGMVKGYHGTPYTFEDAGNAASKEALPELKAAPERISPAPGQSQYRVALQDAAGNVHVGNEGEAHYQLAERLDREGVELKGTFDNGDGFVDRQGKFYNRGQIPPSEQPGKAPAGTLSAETEGAPPAAAPAAEKAPKGLTLTPVDHDPFSQTLEPVPHNPFTHSAEPVSGNPFTVGGINRSHDVPYLAGASNDGKTVYIDKDVPSEMTVGDKTFDPAKYLAIHEQTEHAAMNDGMAYLDAHYKIATPAEKSAVEADGIDWKGYQDQMSALAKKTENEHVKDAPPDLYLKPYPHTEQELIKRHEGDK